VGSGKKIDNPSASADTLDPAACHKPRRLKRVALPVVEVGSRHILLASFSDGDVQRYLAADPKSGDRSSGAAEKTPRKEPPPAALEIDRSAIPSFEEAQEGLATVPATTARHCVEFNWPVRCSRSSLCRAVPGNFLDFQKPDALED
jgi:hypothetical protein